MSTKFPKKKIVMNRNLGVAWYLLASYAYYHEDDPIIEDGEFDWLARFLLRYYYTLTHPHAKLIKRDELEAGTLLLKKHQYPLIIKGALKSIRNQK